ARCPPHVHRIISVRSITPPQDSVSAWPGGRGVVSDATADRDRLPRTAEQGPVGRGSAGVSQAGAAHLTREVLIDRVLTSSVHWQPGRRSKQHVSECNPEGCQYSDPSHDSLVLVDEAAQDVDT